MQPQRPCRPIQIRPPMPPMSVEQRNANQLADNQRAIEHRYAMPAPDPQPNVFDHVRKLEHELKATHQEIYRTSEFYGDLGRSKDELIAKMSGKAEEVIKKNDQLEQAVAQKDKQIEALQKRVKELVEQLEKSQRAVTASATSSGSLGPSGPSGVAKAFGTSSGNFGPSGTSSGTPSRAAQPFGTPSRAAQPFATPSRTPTRAASASSGAPEPIALDGISGETLPSEYLEVLQCFAPPEFPKPSAPAVEPSQPFHRFQEAYRDFHTNQLWCLKAVTDSSPYLFHPSHGPLPQPVLSVSSAHALYNKVTGTSDDRWKKLSFTERHEWVEHYSEVQRQQEHQMAMGWIKVADGKRKGAEMDDGAVRKQARPCAKK